MGLGIRRRIESGAQRYALLRRLLIHTHLARAAFRRHPFDRMYGVKTAGIVPLYLLKRGSAVDADMIIYAGCVPSSVRHALTIIPDVAQFDFFDLGCGLGRALIIASEFGPKSITGMELNADLVARAEVNMETVRRRFPERVPIVVLQGDASDPLINGERSIIFLYHPFGHRIVERLAERIASQVNGTGCAFVIYVNPVHGDVFDADARFSRWASFIAPYDRNELGQGFDSEENVIVWYLGPPDTYQSKHDRSHRIEVVIPDHKVKLCAGAPQLGERDTSIFKTAPQASRLASFEQAIEFNEDE